MIKTKAEYGAALRRLREDEQADPARWQAIVAKGFTAEQAEKLMEPWLCFRAGWAEEIERYEAVRRGELPVVPRLEGFGRLLIALRVAQGLTQRQLAERLGVSEAAGSRCTRNQHHRIHLDCS